MLELNQWKRVHIKTRNELEQTGTSWNKLERAGTNWNALAPPGTRWTQEQTDTDKQEINRSDCACNSRAQ